MRRPNFLIIYTDQQRWDGLGVNGNPDIHTPHLDRLANQSVNFDRCFVQNPVCMPSRLSFLTGQYPSTLGITHMGVPVPEDLMTLPRLLKQYGYRTANIGKLHFLPHANRDHRLPHPAYGVPITRPTASTTWKSPTSPAPTKMPTAPGSAALHPTSFPMSASARPPWPKSGRRPWELRTGSNTPPNAFP